MTAALKDLGSTNAGLRRSVDRSSRVGLETRNGFDGTGGGGLQRDLLCIWRLTSRRVPGALLCRRLSRAKDKEKP